MPCRPPIRSRTERCSGSALSRNFAAILSKGASSVIATESVAAEPSALKSGSSRRADGGAAASAGTHATTHSNVRAIRCRSDFIARSRTGAILRRRGRAIHDLVREIELLARHAQRFHHLITRGEACLLLTLAPYVPNYNYQRHGCRKRRRRPNETGHPAWRRRGNSIAARALFRRARQHARGEFLAGIDGPQGFSKRVVQVLVH